MNDEKKSKKIISFILVGIGLIFVILGIVLVPQKKTIVCTNNTVDADGYKRNSKYEILYNSEKILKIKQTEIVELDPSTLNLALTYGNAFAKEANQFNGVSCQYSKEKDNQLKLIMEVDYQKLDQKQLKKADESSTKTTFDFSKEYTINQFQKEILKGYTCK